MNSTATEFDLKLRSGRLRAQRWGTPDLPLVLCIHGISAHMHAFDFLGPTLAALRRQVVAVDLRGRGRSDQTGPGSYGLEAHARDVLEVASTLGAERFDLVGWSLGALIGIGVANLSPGRLRRFALIDHAGPMDRGARDTVERGFARLDVEVARPEAYVDAIRAAGLISPWTDFWTRYYEYELAPCAGGYKATTRRDACLEDLAKFVATDWPALWKGVVMPALLLRCTVPIGGDIVPVHARVAFKAAAPQLQIVELPTNHFRVMTDPAAAKALVDFFSAGGA